jgi:ABC-2 type transport system permease protein
MKILRDSWLIFQHESGLMVRNPFMVGLSLAQPIAYLIFFAPFLKVAMAGQGATSYGDAYRTYVPGLFVAMGLFGGLFAGYGLLSALRAGIIDRCRVTPISRTALLLGRAMMHVALILVQAIVITLTALPFGLRVQPAYALVAYALLGMMALLSTSISYDVALIVRSENSLGVLVNTVATPVSLLAGVLIPLSLAPLWIRRVALWNPFAWATDGMRALFNGAIGDRVVWQSALIVTTLTVACVAWSSRLFNREVS